MALTEGDVSACLSFYIVKYICSKEINTHTQRCNKTEFHFYLWKFYDLSIMLTSYKSLLYD